MSFGLLLALLGPLAQLASATCANCGPGMYWLDFGGSGMCMPCPQGRYCLGYCNSTVLCQTGTYNPNPGGNSSASCLPCEPGYCGNQPGEATCTACAAGKYCPGSGRACSDALPCAAGNFSNAGSAKCSQCPAGFRCSLLGALVACPNGTYSAAGSTTCTPCSGGYACPDPSQPPVICPAGTYSSSGALTCTACADGSYSSSSGSSSCNPCSAGSACVNKAAAPTQCPKGSYSGGSQKTCTSCPVGTYADSLGSTQCTVCPPGKSCFSTAMTPVTCPAGSFSTSGATNCTACPAGRTPTASQDSCTMCPAGFECSSPSLGPQPCSPGYYSSQGATISCTISPAGSMAPVAHNSPIPCPSGSFSVDGQTNCTKCWAGYSCTGGAAPVACSSGQYSLAGQGYCSACPPGFKCPSPSQKVACEAGTYSTGSALTCTPCPAGAACPFQTGGPQSCQSGYYSLGNAGACTKCPPGSKCYDSSQAPVPCSTGEYSTGGTTYCTTCPAGKMCPTKTGLPQTCPQGTYSTGGATSCSSCPAGYACPSQTSNSKIRCWPGSYSVEGVSNCEVCPIGKECPHTDVALEVNCQAGYYSLGNQSSCTQCPAGKQCPYTDGTGILDCLAGQYSTGGKAMCTTCPAGMACNSTTAALQFPCAPGTYSTSGKSVCTQCPAGYACPKTNAATQVQCGVGYYSQAGQAECSLCQNGYFCPTSGGLGLRTVMIPCSAGSYTDKPSASCTKCPAGKFCPSTDAPPLICEPGFYSLGNSSSCTACEAGYACGDGIKKLCPAGTHSGPNAVACETCPGGYWCNGTAITTASLPNRLCRKGGFCPPGGWDSHLKYFCFMGFCPCEKGTYNPNQGASKRAQCLPCPAGTACEEKGMIKTLNCSRGHYCPEGSRTRWAHACPAGTVGTNVAQTSINDCAVCPAGQFCPPAYSGSTANHRCPPGHFCPEGTRSAFENPCPQGTFTAALASTHIQNCTGCPQGFYCPQGSTGPVPCPEGTYNPTTMVGEITGCLESPSGFYSNGQGVWNLSAIKQNVCPRGYYCPTKTVSGTQYSCPPGTYGNFTGLTHFSQCLACPAGKFCTWATTGPAGATPWVDCTPGHFCPERTTSPTENPCPAGTYYALQNATQVSDCIQCPAGSYCEGGQGSISGACARGHYCPAGSNQSRPFPCPSGTYNPHNNATSPADCLGCPIGKYCLDGETTPRNCSEGTFTNRTYTANDGLRFNMSSYPRCTSCPAGFKCAYGAVNGTRNPTRCLAGTYSKAGDIECRECKKGYYCDEDIMTESQMLARVCPKGYYCPAGTSTPPTTLCVPGTYCEAGAEEMVKCPPGTYNPQYNQSECVTCPAGKYCIEGAANISGVCEPGNYCPAGSSASKSRPCPGGTYLNRTGATNETECLQCYEGFHCPVGSVLPTVCPMGSYCPDNVEWPMGCPKGTYSNKTGLTHADNCTKCDGGAYCDSMGLTAISGKCTPGHYCIGGASKPNPIDGISGALCPKGHYCPEGVELPSACPPGTYNRLNGSRRVDACLACRPGYYCDGFGLTEVTGCCEAGWYCTGGADKPRQFHAPPGHYSDACAEDPTPCPLKTYNPTQNQSSCWDCPAGSYCPEMGMSSLTGFACPKGSYCPAGVQVEIPCPVGTFSNTTGKTSADTCTKCLPGYYCDTNGLKAPSGPCNAGYWCGNGSYDPNPTIQTFGGMCPAGKYCEAGSDEGIPCPIGTFRPTTLAKTQSDCLPCPAGWACNSTGLVAPVVKCGAGYYCGASASSTKPVTSGQNGLCTTGHECPAGVGAPLACPPGTYSDVPGLAKCKMCPAGFYCAGTTVSPVVCPPGFYCPNGTRSANENACPIGTFGNVTGFDSLQACYNCTAGWYCDTPSLDKPVGTCTAGYYCPPGSHDTFGKNSWNAQRICPRGSYCPAATGTPIHCPPGMYSNSTGDVDGSKCIACPPGSYCAMSGLQEPSGLCAPGYYCVGNTTTAMPIDGVTGNVCPTGSYCPAGASQSMPCAPGSYANVTGLPACTACPAGYFCELGAKDRIECPAGNWCPEGTQTRDANVCPRGTYNPIKKRTNATDCLSCPPGYYCATPGLANATGPCEGGYYCTGGSWTKMPNGTNGGMCTKGHYCPVGSRRQKQCLGGNFCQDDGLAAPSGKCYEGYYCDGGSLTARQHMCPPGSYCPNGTKTPIPCPAGSYNPVVGSTSPLDCLGCPSGFYCPRPGVSSVNISVSCTQGFYCTNRTVTPTDQCPRGHRCPPGTGEPHPCPSGTYQDELGQHTCKTCQAGYYCGGNGNVNMTDCPPGYFCLNGTVRANQYPCPDGTFSTKTQVASAADCTPCLGGQYCLGTGLTAPTGFCHAGYYCTQGANTSTPTDGVTGAACPSGFYCPMNTTVPRACPMGKFSNGLGNTAASDCTDCPPGRYCAETAAQALSLNNSGLCDPGFLCFGGSSSRAPTDNVMGRPCKPGTYCVSGALQEQECPQGTFNPDYGRGECYNCTAGYVCDEVNMTSTNGKECPPGFYCPTGTIIPRPCPVGSYSFTTARPEAANCTLCPAGMYCNQENLTIPGVGKCFQGYFCNRGATGPAPNGTVTLLGGGGWSGSGPCPKGHYCPNATQAPIACDPGTYNPLLGQDSAVACIDCPTGSYCGTSGLGQPSNVCQAGYYCGVGAITATANTCPLGKMCPPGSATPQNCPGGTYADELGLAQCKMCPKRFYCPANSTNPIMCPIGSYCPNGTEWHLTCPNGTYATIAGMGSKDQCLSCPAGSYCTDGVISGNCSAGFLCTTRNMFAEPTANNTEDWRGEPCPKGHYCPRGAVAAIPCPSATFRGSTGGQIVDDCTACPAGQYCPSGSVRPVDCPRGKYCLYNTDPIMCPARTYRNATNATQLSDCLQCPSGYLCNKEGISDLTPFLCPIMRYCPAGTNISIPCPAGTFQNTTGAGSPDECKSCPGGHYCPDQTPSPIVCKAATYCPPRSSSPTSCPGGYYCPAKTTYAISCPPGEYCPANSSRTYYCGRGTYCDGQNVLPTPCGNGTRTLDVTNRSSFHVACADCLPGKWADNMTTRYCENCTAGYYCAGGASTPTPIYGFQGGEICPAGYYCPAGTPRKIACPAGYYNNRTGQSTADACVMCPANTYNGLEGQSGCLDCSATSTSEAGAAACSCIGKNRIFTNFARACICEGGYTYTDLAGNDASKVDASADCELKVYDRCGAGTTRYHDGTCKSINYDCSDECGSALGKFLPSTGSCMCNDVPDLEDICDSTCRASKPIVEIDGGTIMIYRNSSTGYPMCSFALTELTGYKDYSNCGTEKCKMYMSEAAGNGITGTYSMPSSIKNAALAACPSAATLETVDAFTSRPHLLNVETVPRYSISDIEVGEVALSSQQHGRRLLDTSSTATASFTPALYCLNVGEGLMWSISATSYPTYDGDDLLSSNTNFDGGAFDDLATAQAGLSNFSVMGYTFDEAGTFVFKGAGSADTGERTSIVRVLPTTQQCPSEARIMPFTEANLNSLGVTMRSDLLLSPDWGLIGTMAGLVVGVFLTMVIGARHFKKSGWGASAEGTPGYRKRAQNDGLQVWKFNSEGTVVKEEATSGGLRDIRELDMGDGEGVVTKQPLRNKEGFQKLPSGEEQAATGGKATAAAGKKDKDKHMYEWEDQVSTDDFDFHSLYKQLELSREHFDRHFKNQEQDLRFFYKQMSQETDHLKSVLAVKMNVQLKTSGEGFGEAVRRLVTAEINARKSFGWRFSQMREELWRIVTGDMFNAINTITKDDYTIAAVRNQCRIQQQHIMQMFREIEQERTRRRGFGAHVEVVGVPITKALSDLDFMEKKMQDTLTIKLNGHNTAMNAVLQRIAKLDEKFAAVKKATTGSAGGEERLKREQKKQHLRMIKKAKVVGEKCTELKAVLEKLKDALDTAAGEARQQQDYIVSTLLSEREAEVANKSTNLFRGINPDMAKVLAGLLGMRGGFVYEEKTQTLQRAEPFDPTDPFAGIVDSSLDSEAKVLRGHLDKLKLKMQTHDEENEAEIKKLKEQIDKLKAEHEATRKALEEKARAAEEKAKAEAPAGSIPGAKDEDGEPIKTEAEIKAEMKLETKDEIDMDAKLREAEDAADKRSAQERLDKILKLQEMYDAQKRAREELERKNLEKMQAIQTEESQDESKFDEEVKRLEAGDYSMIKEPDLQLVMKIDGDGEDAREKRRRKIEELRAARQARKNARLKDMEAELKNARAAALEAERKLASQLKQQKVLSSLEGDEVDDADDGIDEAKIKEEYEKKMAELMKSAEDEKNALKLKLLNEEKARATEEKTVNGLISMADKARSQEREKLQGAKDKQLSLIRSRMKKKMALAKRKAAKKKAEALRKAEEEARKASEDADEETKARLLAEAKAKAEKEASDELMRQKIKALQEQLEAEKKLNQQFKEQVANINQKVEGQIQETVTTVGDALKSEAEKEKEIALRVEEALRKKLDLAKKNLDAASDLEDREQLQKEFEQQAARLREQAEKEKEALTEKLRKANDEKLAKEHGEEVSQMMAKSRADRAKRSQALKSEANAKRDALKAKIRAKREAIRKRFEESKKTDEDKRKFLDADKQAQVEAIDAESKLVSDAAAKDAAASDEAAADLEQSQAAVKEKMKEWEMKKAAAIREEAEKKAKEDAARLEQEHQKEVEAKMKEAADKLKKQEEELKAKEEAYRKSLEENKALSAEQKEKEMKNYVDNAQIQRDNMYKSMDEQKAATKNHMKQRLKARLEARRKKAAAKKAAVEAAAAEGKSAEAAAAAVDDAEEDVAADVDKVDDSEELRRRIEQLEQQAKDREEARKKQLEEQKKENELAKAKNEVNAMLDNFANAQQKEAERLKNQRKAAIQRMKARRRRMREARKKKGAQNIYEVSPEERKQIQDALEQLEEDSRRGQAKEIIETVFKSRFKAQRVALVQKTQDKLKSMKAEGDVSVDTMVQQQAKDYSDMKESQDKQVREMFKSMFPDEDFKGAEWRNKKLDEYNEKVQAAMSGASAEAARRMQEIKAQEEEHNRKIAERIERERERAKKRMELRMSEAGKKMAEEKEKYMRSMHDGKQMSDLIIKQFRTDEELLDQAILFEQQRQLKLLEKELAQRKKKVANKKKLRQHMQFLSKSSAQDKVVARAAKGWAGRGGAPSEDDIVVLTEYTMDEFRKEHGATVKPHELEMFKKLKNIEDLMKMYRKSTKDWQRNRFLDTKDRDVFRTSSEIKSPRVCQLEDLTSREVMLYRFGLSLMNVLYKTARATYRPSEAKSEDGEDPMDAATPPLLLLASELPPNPLQTAYKNSFFYKKARGGAPDQPDEDDDHVLFMRRERLKDVGEFILVLVHTTAHVISGHWEDRHPEFLRLFHQLLQYCCADLFFTRANNQRMAGQVDSEIEEVVALKMQLQSNVSDTIPEHQLQQRMRKYMLFTHSDAMQSHLNEVAEEQGAAGEAEAGDAKTHTAVEMGPSAMRLEALADELDQTMCSIVMEMFRVSEEIKKRGQEGGDAAGARLTVQDLQVQLRKLEAQKASVGAKLETVNKQLAEARN